MSLNQKVTRDTQGCQSPNKLAAESPYLRVNGKQNPLKSRCI